MVVVGTALEGRPQNISMDLRACPRTGQAAAAGSDLAEISQLYAGRLEPLAARGLELLGALVVLMAHLTLKHGASEEPRHSEPPGT